MAEPRLSDLGPLWASFVDGLADFQADLLRRMAARMATAVDREARRAVEGSREWRNTMNVRRYQS